MRTLPFAALCVGLVAAALLGPVGFASAQPSGGVRERTGDFVDEMVYLDPPGTAANKVLFKVHLYSRDVIRVDVQVGSPRQMGADIWLERSGSVVASASNSSSLSVEYGMVGEADMLIGLQNPNPVQVMVHVRCGIDRGYWTFRLLLGLEIGGVTALILVFVVLVRRMK